MKNIPVVIMCGGTGTRLREMTEFLPKPLVQIGGKPLVWHIMKIYAHYGFNNFVLALGYKQEVFKEYFAHFHEVNNDVTFGVGRNPYILWPECPQWDWTVTLSDTGANTLKSARLKRIEKYIHEDVFMCTYGDGLSDIDLNELLKFHRGHGKIATITGVHPAPRFGEIHHEGGVVRVFMEKPGNPLLMNGGFMVFNRGIFGYLSDDNQCDLETTVFNRLIEDEQLMVFSHSGFWKCCDTLKDMEELRDMWESGTPKWRIWQ